MKEPAIIQAFLGTPEGRVEPLSRRVGAAPKTE
jgi:hypothetical protein